ncbi:hypothetical protein JI435_103130 [Parastagonospora nodorum SN15]|uniref:Uncharacterized protein n=1 Tax=Phaeosphaeria nodorum (strain SN15 / ATCC MYA-4574 / FGSC 10173) TaxID=321614 RepID=A0A7U2FDZ4_PHANO|nr:hypothetical protein HBH44_083660 [Parastagonospora nodorum]QRD03540.1 hypothetical protein JI435_103130 [Parastagonospora nodorum SN15]KAH5491155.1 hypothetical protein HBI31_125860 [Parastagonospora nodorum]KAH5649117.1 hypothetical protein HBI23_172630 [Parastagonospora nodorum]KAH5679052.1 hypothetical protein HBI21_080850 [Parastagonospora nodorum]
MLALVCARRLEQCTCQTSRVSLGAHRLRYFAFRAQGQTRMAVCGSTPIDNHGR